MNLVEKGSEKEYYADIAEIKVRIIVALLIYHPW